jgi:hypothetical protein
MKNFLIWGVVLFTIPIGVFAQEGPKDDDLLIVPSGDTVLLVERSITRYLKGEENILNIQILDEGDILYVDSYISRNREDRIKSTVFIGIKKNQNTLKMVKKVYKTETCSEVTVFGWFLMGIATIVSLLGVYILFIWKDE